MDSDFRRFRDRVERRIASLMRGFKEWLAGLKTPGKEYGSQRMCPFCGLITPRSKRLCLECGKSLKGIPLERKDAPQG
jgi:hypothetical protein